MSLSALIATSPMGIPVSKTCQPSSHIVPASVRLGLKRAQDHLWLSWLVAVTACFLAVGVAGLFENEDFMPILLSGTKGEGAGEEEGRIFFLRGGPRPLALPFGAGLPRRNLGSPAQGWPRRLCGRMVREGAGCRERWRAGN